jgi:NAD(P)-dependent dehydrogenase (short-subunit alcohol dehydrogenase family)
VPVQPPLGSGFGAASTTSDVLAGIDLTGKVAFVTGANSGLGLETARALASVGAQIAVIDRSHERSSEVLSGHDVQYLVGDFLEPNTIGSAADEFLAGHRPIHILINCAGIMAYPLTRDARGYEYHLATNHLGHFQLTARLWPALEQAHGARVVAFSSMGHRYSPFDFDNPNFEHRDYTPSAAYGQSKTADALFAVELDRRAQSKSVRAFAVHPGNIAGTGLERLVPKETLIAAGVIDPDGNPILDPKRQNKTVPQGAATAVWAATSPTLNGLGGLYCENCDVAGEMTGQVTGTMADSTVLTGVMAHAIDPQLAIRLWTLTEKLVGVTFLE